MGMFFLGLFLGACIGVVIMGLMAAAGRSDDREP